MTTKSARKYLTGITIEPEVREYVDALATHMRMSRSWVINALIREHSLLIQRGNQRPFQNLPTRQAVIHL